MIRFIILFLSVALQIAIKNKTIFSDKYVIAFVKSTQVTSRKRTPQAGDGEAPAAKSCPGGGEQ